MVCQNIRSQTRLFISRLEGLQQEPTSRLTRYQTKAVDLQDGSDCVLMMTGVAIVASDPVGGPDEFL